jgi:hypothetical protein
MPAGAVIVTLTSVILVLMHVRLLAVNALGVETGDGSKAPSATPSGNDAIRS